MHNTLGVLSAYLKNTDILEPGENYTFTWDHGRLFEYRDETWVTGQLVYFLQNYGSVLAADRPLLSDRYIIVVRPSKEATLAQWIDGFNYSWDKMGYGNATFIIAEGGVGSSQPGGASELARTVGESAGGILGGVTAGTLGALLKTTWPYLAAGAAVLLLIEVIRSKK